VVDSKCFSDAADQKLLSLVGLGPFRNEMCKDTSCRSCHTVVTGETRKTDGLLFWVLCNR